MAAEQSPTPSFDKVRVAYSSISGNMGPLWVTFERNLFRKHGLDVELVFVEGGSRAAETLAAGDVAFAHMAGAGIIQSNLRGSDVVMIAGVINTLTFQLFVSDSVKQPDDLKGKIVAVTRHGSSTDFAMRYTLEKYGLNPESDVKIVELGTMPALVAGLKSAKIHGAMLSAPSTLQAKKSGFPVLADLQMLGLDYQHTGIATTRALAKSRPDLVQKFMKGYIEGIHYYKNHRSESLAILAKYLKTNDNEALSEIYEDVGLKLVPQKPYPTLRGIHIILRELEPKDPKAANARPEQFVDLSFMRELDSSGFIDNLYKTPAVASRRERASAPAVSGWKKSAPVQARTDVKTGGSEKAEQRIAALSTTVTTRASGAGSEYTIVRGDTLSKLAEQFYGSQLKWPKIYQANTATIKNPNYLYIGQRITIPAV
jgi:NitT/TauT family transport system substrate-binding protein